MQIMPLVVNSWHGVTSERNDDDDDDNKHNEIR